MPLSEYEQRVWEELERDLDADPKLGRSARQPRARGRVLLAAIGVIVGLSVLVVGVASNMILVGVAGFAVMAASALWALLAPAPGAAQTTPSAARSKGAKPGKRKGGFMSTMEERFERRRDEGDL